MKIDIFSEEQESEAKGTGRGKKKKEYGKILPLKDGLYLRQNLLV